MYERNHLGNGRFLHDLDQWTSSGAAYSAGDGDDHYGVAVLSTGGDYVLQTFSVPSVRAYTLHLSVKSVGAALSGSQAVALITDGNGNTVKSQSLAGNADEWHENEVTLGLAPGTTYTLKISNDSASGDVKIDDVWLWHVPMTRAEIAKRVHAKLAALATDRELTPYGPGSKTEGDYTYAIDTGLRNVAALNPETGLPDVRYLDPDVIDTALEAVQREMLEQLQIDLSTEVDIQVGPRRESLSQTGAAISKILNGDSGGSTGGKVVVRNLRHAARDYNLGEHDV